MSNYENNNLNKLLDASHTDPFSFLGLHHDPATGLLLIRTFQPFARKVSILSKITGKTIKHLQQVHDSGLFTASVHRKKHFPYLLKVIDHKGERRIEDPYSFPEIIAETDISLLASGQHHKAYSILGAQNITMDNVTGFSFAVWAPNASHVSVVGDFNHWDGRMHQMRLRHAAGIWEIFIPNLQSGENYKFQIKNRKGRLLPLKSDPYAFQSQFRPENSSVTVRNSQHQWQDQKWFEQGRKFNARNEPISIYEVHLGSWKRKENNDFLNYRELADLLINYCKELHFTHLQLMPVSEYPFDGSWGYQPIGLFAPTSRFATGEDTVVEDFQYFVDQCHLAELGIIIDWVPGHFPEDEHGLAQFDGSYLFEHEDRQKGFHPDWNTLIYNYGRTEVTNFLIASAIFWLDKFHIDAIRVDAVASMLYLDYSREDGEWTPNEHGGNENLEAIAFLKKFNEQLYLDYSDAFSVAEESTAWPGVSKPTNSGGLGFGYKWNMGWMNDSLQYMSKDPVHRKFHQNDLSFSLVYAFDENFILPLSHDEVVHGKRSLLEKMPGDQWKKFANLRAYYGFMWTHPGKKLLFMGGEFAQSAEWNFDQELDWFHLEQAPHSGIQMLIKDLNQLYKNRPALYEKDCETDGFEWIDHSDSAHSIYSFIRYGSNRNKPIIVLCNFTPDVYFDYQIGVPLKGNYREIFNTDAAIYGGSNKINPSVISTRQQAMHNREVSISVIVPPLATIMFEVK